MAGWQVRATSSPLHLLSQVACQLLGSGQGAVTTALCRDGGGSGDLFKEKMLFLRWGRDRAGALAILPLEPTTTGVGGVYGGGQGRDSGIE